MIKSILILTLPLPFLHLNHLPLPTTTLLPPPKTPLHNFLTPLPPQPLKKPVQKLYRYFFGPKIRCFFFCAPFHRVAKLDGDFYVGFVHEGDCDAE